MPASFLACLAFVSTFYHLPPRVLPAIALVEGGRPGIVQPDADGSADLGLMQINTRWIEPIARHTGLPGDQVRRRLIAEPCFSVATAGAIMRIYLDEEHGDLMRAIGDYHSHTPTLNLSYQSHVLGAARRLWPWAFSSTGTPAAAPPAGR